MAIPRFDEDLAIISKLGDNPGSDNNLTTDAFRAKFDEGPQKIQQYLNEVLIPAAEQSSSPQEGLSMQGAINMNGQKLFGITDPENSDDAVNLRYLKNALVISSAIITLPANGWVKGEDLEYSQTINLEGIGDPEKCHVFSNPMPESRDSYLDADVYGKSQSVGSLTFGCKYEPKEDIMLKLIIFGGNVIGNNTGGNTEDNALLSSDGYILKSVDELYLIPNINY